MVTVANGIYCAAWGTTDRSFAIAMELKFVSERDYQSIEDRTSEVLRLTNALIDSLRAKSNRAGA